MYCGGMTKPIQPARIIGGPLNGREYRPVSQWPAYLTDGGETLAPVVGDRIFGDRKYRGRVQSCYRLVRVPGGVQLTYVHSSAVKKQ